MKNNEELLHRVLIYLYIHFWSILENKNTKNGLQKYRLKVIH